MKKYILTMVASTMAISSFAFNFNEDNLKVDANIKAQINPIIVQEINVNIEEVEELENIKQDSDNEIISVINEQMQIAMREIKRNANFRKNIFTRSFVEEQKIQKQRYENMIRWNVPTRIYEYVEANFDLSKVQNPWAACVHNNSETLVELRFNYLSNYIIVYFDYKDKSIKHIIN